MCWLAVWLVLHVPMHALESSLGDQSSTMSSLLEHGTAPSLAQSTYSVDSVIQSHVNAQMLAGAAGNEGCKGSDTD